MSDSPNELDFRLTSELLTDEDKLMKYNFREGGSFRFLTALSQRSSPLKGGFVLSSPVAGSTETGNDENYYILSELPLPQAQKLSPKNLQQSGSPQSALLNVGSLSGRGTVFNKESSDEVSRNHNDWDLMYKVAGVSPSVINPTVFERQRSFSMHPPSPEPSTHSFIHPNDLVRIEDLLGQQECGMQSIHVRHVQNCCNLERSSPGRIGSSGDLAAWHGGAFYNRQFGIENHPHLLAAGASGGLLSGGGYGVATHGIGVGGVMKSQRVGTGVFLPRKYSDNGRSNAVETHKKSGYSGKKNMYMHTLKQHNNDTIPEPEVSSVNHELCLPQDWTY